MRQLKLFIGISAMFFAALFTACGENGNENEINLPPTAVTEANLNEFLDSLAVALIGPQARNAREGILLEEFVYPTVNGLERGQKDLSGNSMIIIDNLPALVVKLQTQEVYTNFSNGGNIYLNGTIYTTTDLNIELDLELIIKYEFGLISKEEFEEKIEEMFANMDYSNTDFRVSGTINFNGWLEGELTFTDFYMNIGDESKNRGTVLIKSHGNNLQADITQWYYEIFKNMFNDILAGL